ncbi:MAG: CHAT domain-containing protein [Cytophagaceae bacterium]|jgi:CHAT domain-containing protein|nr:CHAT domain-containing protein [Cytophagaceae bacterium]
MAFIKFWFPTLVFHFWGIYTFAVGPSTVFIQQTVNKGEYKTALFYITKNQKSVVKKGRTEEAYILQLYKGMAHYFLGNMEQATADWKQAAAIAPHSLPEKEYIIATSILQEVLAHQGNLLYIEEWMHKFSKEAYALNSEAFLYGVLLDIHVLQAKHNRAAALLQLDELSQRLLSLHTSWKTRLYTQLQIQRMEVYASMGYWIEVNNRIEQLYHDPAVQLTTEDQVICSYYTGLLYSQKKEWSNAEHAYKKALGYSRQLYSGHHYKVTEIGKKLYYTLLQQSKKEEALYYNKEIDAALYAYFPKNNFYYWLNQLSDVDYYLHTEQWARAGTTLDAIKKSGTISNHHAAALNLIHYQIRWNSRFAPLATTALWQELLETAQNLQGNSLLTQEIQIEKFSYEVLYNGNLHQSKPQETSLFFKSIGYHTPLYKMYKEACFFLIYTTPINQISIQADTIGTGADELVLEEWLKAQYVTVYMYMGQWDKVKDTKFNASLSQRWWMFHPDLYQETLNQRIVKAFNIGNKNEQVSLTSELKKIQSAHMPTSLGVYYVWKAQGRLNRAENILKDAITNFHQNFPLHPTLAWQYRTHVIENAIQEGNFASVHADVLIVEDGLANLPSNCLIALYSNRLVSTYYYNLGDIEKCLPFSKEAVAIATDLGKHSLTYIDTYWTWIQRRLEQSNTHRMSADSLSEVVIKSVTTLRDEMGDSSLFYVHHIERAAYIALLLKKYTIAKQLYSTALEIWRLRHKDDYAQARVLYQLGKVHQQLQEPDAAQQSYSKTQQILAQTYSKEHPLYCQANGKLAQIAWIKGNKEEAFKKSAECIEATKVYVEKVFPVLSERSKSGFWNQQKEHIDFYIYVRATHGIKAEDWYDVMDIHQQTSTLLLEHSKKVSLSNLVKADSTVTAWNEQWQEQREILAYAYSLSTKELKEQALSIPQIEAEIERLEKNLSQFSADHKKHFQKISYTSSKAFHQTLEPNQSLVVIVTYPQFSYVMSDTVRYTAFVLNGKETTPHPVPLGTGNTLENKWYKYYTNTWKNNLTDTLSYQRYWKAVDASMPSAKTVYLIADGVYHRINPEVFRTTPTRFWIQDKQVIRLGSILDAQGKEVPVSTDLGITLVGNPKYYAQETDKSQIPQLPGSEEEVKGIYEYLTSIGWHAALLLDTVAVETAMDSLHYNQIIHFSTHGFYIPSQPRNSEATLIDNPYWRTGILLYDGGRLMEQGVSSINKAPGVLTSFETLQLPLNATRLVVLSACESGLGDIRMGEGLFGLPRAFQIAGTESVMVSLIKVNDAVTKELMLSFYTKWMKGASKHTAFLQAKLQILNKYADPSLWGAFILIGK